jgi:hypothetical protein
VKSAVTAFALTTLILPTGDSAAGAHQRHASAEIRILPGTFRTIVALALLSVLFLSVATGWQPTQAGMAVLHL